MLGVVVFAYVQFELVIVKLALVINITHHVDDGDVLAMMSIAWWKFK